MKRYIDGFNGILLAVMFLITFWQIIARFIPGDATVWSEEMARFLFVWIVFLGAATLTADDEHIRIGVISDRIGPRAGRILRIIIIVIVLPFVAIMSWGSYLNMIRQWNTFAPTVAWVRLGYVYLGMLISGMLMIWYLSCSLLRNVFRAKYSQSGDAK